jgi:hypothetical protein
MKVTVVVLEETSTLSSYLWDFAESSVRIDTLNLQLLTQIWSYV